MKIDHDQKIDVAATFACLGALVLWSASPVFIKFLTGYLDSWTQNFLRYTAACLFWLPFLLLSLKKNRIDKKIWKRALLPAIVNIITQSLWAATLYYINPAFMSLLIKSSLIWIAIFSFIFFVSERPLLKSLRFWAGLTLAIIGVIGVLIFKQGFTQRTTMTGIILALVASFMWAVYTMTVKIAFKDTDSRHGFAVVSIYTVIGLAALAFAFGNISDCTKMPPWPWACIVISGITAIGFSHVLYYFSIKRIGATIPSLILLSSPFIILLISNIVFGETLNTNQSLFGLILLIGAALAIWSQQHLRPNPKS